MLVMMVVKTMMLLFSGFSFMPNILAVFCTVSQNPLNQRLLSCNSQAKSESGQTSCFENKVLLGHSHAH